MSSESCMSFSASEERGVMEHLKGMICLGISISLTPIDSHNINGGTYRVKFGVHWMSGSISLPSSSFALVMSKTVRIDAIEIQREFRAKNRPAHILKGVNPVITHKCDIRRMMVLTFVRTRSWEWSRCVFGRSCRLSGISLDGMYVGLDNALHLARVPW